MRCDGSWQRWHASRLRMGTTVRRMVPPRVSMTRLEPRWSGGNWWHAWQVGESIARSLSGCSGALENRTLPRRSSSTTDSTRGCRPKRLDHPRDQAAVVLHHLVLERDANQLALGQRGRARGLEQRLEVMDGVDVGAHGAGERHGGRDADRQADRHARQPQSHAAPPGSIRRIVAPLPGPVKRLPERQPRPDRLAGACCSLEDPTGFQA